MLLALPAKGPGGPGQVSAPCWPRFFRLCSEDYLRSESRNQTCELGRIIYFTKLLNRIQIAHLLI